MSMLPVYHRSPARRRQGYGLDPFGFFGSLSPSNFMDMLNRSSDISTSVTDGAVTYEVNLAGFDQSEVSVKVDPRTNMLQIDAARDRDGMSVRKSHAIYLGDEKVSAENLKSSYRNGLLSITVSKPELLEGEAFDVPIEAADGSTDAVASIGSAEAASADKGDTESSAETA